MNVTFSNNFEHILDLENHLKIVYGILFIIFQLLSITCYSGFIYFEHYGGDPMKRSIKNKLISQGFLVLMMAIVVNNSGIAWRIIIGPLNPKISVIVIFVRQFSTFIIVVCITEIVLFKVFMLYGWTYFCSMDEGFLSKTILNFNCLFGFGSQCCRWVLGSLETHLYELLNGVLLSSTVSHIRYFWPVSLTISGSIILIGILALGIKNYKIYVANKNRVQEIHIALESQNSNFNIEIHNTPLLGIGVMLGFMRDGNSFLITLIWQATPRPNMAPN